MVNNKRKKSKIHYLKLEIKIHKLIITRLLTIITKNKIQLQPDLLEEITILYGGGNGTKEESQG